MNRVPGSAPRRWLFAIATGMACLCAAPGVTAMTSLEDVEMAMVDGEGIAIALDNFQYAMAPTSYFEQYGSTPANNCTNIGDTAGNKNCWRRGDLRWYGVNISGAGNAGYHWDDTTTCTPTAANPCPRGGLITWFSPFDNPYIIRAWSPQGMGYDGGCINGNDGAGGCDPAISDTTKALYEFLAPTARNGADTGAGQPDYIFSFWGEIEAGSTRNTRTQTLATGTGGVGWGLLKTQSIIRGNAAGSVFRLFRFPQAGNLTFAMYYHSYLRGNFRFSTMRSGGSASIGLTPVFEETEGLLFRNVEAFLPFGQLYYQALTLGPVGTNGSFYLQLTPIPNTPEVYGKFYGAAAGDTRGYATARDAVERPAAPTGNATANYRLSHGYSRWGGWYPAWGTGYTSADNAPVSNTLNFRSSVGDGIVFRSCPACATYLAFADRPIRIDKRGETAGMHRTQNYNCLTGDAGGCAVGPGPIVSGPGDLTKTFPVAAGVHINLGDSRIEGLLIHRLRIESCPKTGAC